MTEPLLPKTLPYRTAKNFVGCFFGFEYCCALINNFSINNFVAPYVFSGETALSLPIQTALSTSFSKQASITF